MDLLYRAFILLMIFVRKCLRALGWVEKEFSSHSFWIGAATEAARSGLDVDSVKAYWVVGIKEVLDSSSASTCGWVVKY